MLVVFIRDLTGGIRKHVLSTLIPYLNNPKNILIVTHLKLADAQFERFIELHPEFKKQIIDTPIRRSPHPIDLWHLFKLLLLLRSRTTCKTLFHGHGAKGGMFARLLGFMLRRKTLYTAHGGSLHSMHGSLSNFIFIVIEKFLYYLTDRVVFESKYSQHVFESRIKSDSHKFVLNYNGVAFLERPQSPPQYQHGDLFRLGAFGALRHIKGYDVLLRAIQIVFQKNYRFELSIYGQGEERGSLPTLAEDLGINSVVKFISDAQDVEHEMMKCHLVVQPSRFESFGYTALEAIELKIPVIVSQVGGLQEIVKSNTDGQSFASENHSELAECIIKSIEDYDKCIKMANAAYDRAKIEFNEKLMVAKLHKVYDELRD